MIVAKPHFQASSLPERQRRPYSTVGFREIGVGVLGAVDAAQKLGRKSAIQLSFDGKSCVTPRDIELRQTVVSILLPSAGQSKCRTIAHVVPSDARVRYGVVGRGYCGGRGSDPARGAAGGRIVNVSFAADDS